MAFRIDGEEELRTMAKLTIGFGIALIALGVLGYVDTGSTHPTALIPTWAGLLFVLLGALSNTADSKRRMLWMHTAVTLALLGVLGSGARSGRGTGRGKRRGRAG